MPNDDEAWFAPKAFGYGAGPPVRWQGWAVLAAFLAVVVVAQARLARRRPVAFVSVMGLSVLALIAVAAPRTRRSRAAARRPARRSPG